MNRRPLPPETIERRTTSSALFPISLEGRGWGRGGRWCVEVHRLDHRQRLHSNHSFIDNFWRHVYSPTLESRMYGTTPFGHRFTFFMAFLSPRYRAAFLLSSMISPSTTSENKNYRTVRGIFSRLRSVKTKITILQWRLSNHNNTNNPMSQSDLKGKLKHRTGAKRGETRISQVTWLNAREVSKAFLKSSDAWRKSKVLVG